MDEIELILFGLCLSKVKIKLLYIPFGVRALLEAAMEMY